MSVVTDLPAPPAARLRPPSWRDPRLLVGVLLVLGSVVLGARVVAAADDTEPYYVAARAITPGDRIGPDDLRVVDVRLGDAGEGYLGADAGPAADLVATRTVAAGELVPRGSVGAASDVALQPVAVPVTTLPDGLRAGTVVDVWVAQPDPERAGAFLEPERVVQGADVADVGDAGSSLGSTGDSTVQVLLAPDVLPVVLGALANDAVVSLVPAPGQGG
ncbi:flagellar protein FlgA [Angustibacter speluncae]